MGFAALYTILRIQMRGPACVEPGRRTWMLFIVAEHLVAGDVANSPG
jgi:hypothetical protein